MPRPVFRWSRRRRSSSDTRLRRTARFPVTRRNAERRQLVSLLSRAGGIRRELVDRVRAEIQAGTYDDPVKLASALERMLMRLTTD